MMARLLQLGSICLAVLPIWLLLRRPWRRSPIAREIALGSFAVFMAGLAALVLEGDWVSPGAMLSRAAERLRTHRNMNFTPLHIITRQLSTITSDTSLTLLGGNILMFVPWGFFLPLLWRRFRYPLTMAGMALLLTCCIEGTQLFIERMVDVDDLILNFSGSMLGAGLWWLIHRFWAGLDERLAVR